MTRIVRFVVIAFIAAMALAVVRPAAASVDECQVQIADLRAATDGATFIGRNAEKDELGLIGKLDSASTKLDQGKLDDAVQALENFRDKVVTLDAQGKIDHDDAAGLIVDANLAITCVQELAG